MRKILAITLALLLCLSVVAVAPIVLAEEIDSTTVDFNEDFYVDTVHTNEGGHNYEYTNGTYSGNKSTIAFAELTTDSEKGNVVKFASIGSNTNDNSSNSDEIVLHSSGHASSYRLYLRIKTQPKPKDPPYPYITLQIACSDDLGTIDPENFTIKLRKLI
jgi:hypothetical protein